jgi:hypothetical protein
MQGCGLPGRVKCGGSGLGGENATVERYGQRRVDKVNEWTRNDAKGGSRRGEAGQESSSIDSGNNCLVDSAGDRSSLRWQWLWTRAVSNHAAAHGRAREPPRNPAPASLRTTPVHDHSATRFRPPPRRGDRRSGRQGQRAAAMLPAVASSPAVPPVPLRPASKRTWASISSISRISRTLSLWKPSRTREGTSWHCGERQRSAARHATISATAWQRVRRP